MTTPHRVDAEPTGPGRSLRVIVAAVAVTAAGMLPVWLVGGLAVQMRADLAFDEFQLGIATAAFFGVSALASVPGSRMVERIGWRRGAMFTGAVSAVGLLTIAVGARTWGLLVAALCVAAIANSTAQPSANLGLARTVPATRQGLAFGVKQAAIPLTTMMSGLAVPLIAVIFGWRWVFVTGAMIGIGLVTMVRPGPRQAVPLRRDRPKLGGAGDAPFKTLVVLSVASGLATAATNSLGSFMVSYAVLEGMGPGAAGWLFAGSSALGLIVRVLSGWRADRRGGGHLVFCATMMTGGAIGFALFAVGGSPVVLIVAALMCFGLGWSWNGVFTFAIVEANRGAPAAATGVIMSAKFVGGTAGPLIFGFLASRVSYVAAWLCAASLMALAATLMLVGRAYLRRLRVRTEQADPTDPSDPADPTDPSETFDPVRPPVPTEPPTTPRGP